MLSDRAERSRCHEAMVDSDHGRLVDALPVFGELVERLGDHDGRPFRQRFIGPFDLTQGVDVGAVVQRSGLPVARVTHRPQPFAVGGAGAEEDRAFNPGVGACSLDPTDRPRQCGWRIVLQSIGERQVKQGLRVGGALDVGEEAGADVKLQLALDPMEFGDGSVVLEQPPAVLEGMAVSLLDRGAGGGPHVGEEHGRFHVVGQVTQVGVVPRRLDVAIHCRRTFIAVPADAESVAVRGLNVLPGVPRLVDQRVIRPGDEVAEKKRWSGISEPSAHGNLQGSGGVTAYEDKKSVI